MRNLKLQLLMNTLEHAIFCRIFCSSILKTQTHIYGVGNFLGFNIHKFLCKLVNYIFLFFQLFCTSGPLHKWTHVFSGRRRNSNLLCNIYNLTMYHNYRNYVAFWRLLVKYGNHPNWINPPAAMICNWCKHNHFCAHILATYYFWVRWCELKSE